MLHCDTDSSVSTADAWRHTAAKSSTRGEHVALCLFAWRRRCRFVRSRGLHAMLWLNPQSTATTQQAKVLLKVQGSVMNARVSWFNTSRTSSNTKYVACTETCSLLHTLTLFHIHRACFRASQGSNSIYYMIDTAYRHAQSTKPHSFTRCAVGWWCCIIGIHTWTV
jgi:hypothetical protein